MRDGSVLYAGREVEAEIDLRVAIEGDTLLCEATHGLVHTDEEIETCQIEIDKPSEAAAICAGHEVGRCREDIDRADVGRESEFGSCEEAVEGSGVDQAEVQPAIVGELILHTPVEGGAQRASLSAYIPFVFELIEIRELILHIIPSILGIVAAYSESEGVGVEFLHTVGGGEHRLVSGDES